MYCIVFCTRCYCIAPVHEAFGVVGLLQMFCFQVSGPFRSHPILLSRVFQANVTWWIRSSGRFFEQATLELLPGISSHPSLSYFASTSSIAPTHAGIESWNSLSCGACSCLRHDTCNMTIILVPCTVAALLLTSDYSLLEACHATFQSSARGSSFSTWLQVLWTFSEFIEGFAMAVDSVFFSNPVQEAAPGPVTARKCIPYIIFTPPRRSTTTWRPLEFSSGFWGPQRSAGF